MAERSAWPENSRLGEIFNNRFSVGVKDVKKFTGVAAGVDMNRDIEFAGSRNAFLEQRGLTGFCLRRIENALQSSVMRTAELPDEIHRAFEAWTSLVFTLFVVVPALSIG